METITRYTQKYATNFSNATYVLKAAKRSYASFNAGCVFIRIYTTCVHWRYTDMVKTVM